MLKIDLKDKINVTVAKMELHTAVEQIQMSSKADVIIGVHGNGLTNVLWMPKGGLVIELFPPGSCQFGHQWISSVSSQNYAGISHDLVIPRYNVIELKEPCRTLFRTGKWNQVFPLIVSLVHKG